MRSFDKVVINIIKSYVFKNIQTHINPLKMIVRERNRIKTNLSKEKYA